MIKRTISMQDRFMVVDGARTGAAGRSFSVKTYVKHLARVIPVRPFNYHMPDSLGWRLGVVSF